MRFPVLVVLTGVVLYQTMAGTAAPVEEEIVSGPPTIGSAGTAIIGAPPRGLTEFDASLPAGQLPAGGAFTEAGAKTWRIIPGTSPKVGEGTAKTFTYTVEIEDGIDTSSFGGDEGFARMVTETLSNPKSWTHNPQFAFERVDAAGCQARLPHLADHPGNGAGRLWLRDPAGNLLLQPDLRRRRRAAGVHQPGALGARGDALPG